MRQYADLDLIARLKKLDMVRVAVTKSTKKMFVVLAAVVPATQEPLGHVIKHIQVLMTGPLVEKSVDLKAVPQSL